MAALVRVFCLTAPTLPNTQIKFCAALHVILP